jgi:uncharacterized protein YggE
MPAYFTAFLTALLLLSPLTARAATATQIAVGGTGAVTLPPDEATVSATVETYDGHSASVAVANNSGIYERAVAAIAALGVAAGDISLSAYNVRYNPPPNERSGYTVDRTFLVKVHKLSLAGAVVDAATNAGASQINSVSFGLADTTAAATQAMQRAVDDATAKATALARAAHLRIVGIATITAGGGYIPEPQPVARIAMAAVAPTTFEPGNTTITQTVNVVFLAKP